MADELTLEEFHAAQQTLELLGISLPKVPDPAYGKRYERVRVGCPLCLQPFLRQGQDDLGRLTYICVEHGEWQAFRAHRSEGVDAKVYFERPKYPRSDG